MNSRGNVNCSACSPLCSLAPLNDHAIIKEVSGCWGVSRLHSTKKSAGRALHWVNVPPACLGYWTHLGFLKADVCREYRVMLWVLCFCQLLLQLRDNLQAGTGSSGTFSCPAWSDLWASRDMQSVPDLGVLISSSPTQGISPSAWVRKQI